MAKKRVCYVVCYKDPYYTRTNSLVNALASIRGVDLLVIRNRHKGPLRYLEVPARLLAARVRFKPDVFVVGFRAHEIFWALYPSMAGKKIIFDEFIDHHDWLLNEHQKKVFVILKPLISLLDSYMKIVMRLSHKVLTDTDAHARLAVRNYGVPTRKVVAIPVGADESVFDSKASTRPRGRRFEVLFYGSMLPLHGIEVILGAVRRLKDAHQLQDIHFTLVGGNARLEREVRRFGESEGIGSNVKYLKWVDYQKLPALIQSSSVGLGGPFGVTGQASRVITGKTFQFLALGKPVIIGRTTASSAFQDKHNCLIVKRGSAPALAEAIIWAKDHQSELPAIGRRGRELYRQQFSQRVQSQKLALLIDELTI